MLHNNWEKEKNQNELELSNSDNNYICLLLLLSKLDRLDILNSFGASESIANDLWGWYDQFLDL